MNLQLISSEHYSNFICHRCEKELKYFSELQKKLVAYQTRLYMFVAKDAGKIVTDSAHILASSLDDPTDEEHENNSIRFVTNNVTEIGTVVEDEAGQFTIIYPSESEQSQFSSHDSNAESGQKNNKKLKSSFATEHKCARCERNFQNLRQLMVHLVSVRCL